MLYKTYQIIDSIGRQSFHQTNGPGFLICYIDSVANTMGITAGALQNCKDKIRTSRTRFGANKTYNDKNSPYQQNSLFPILIRSTQIAFKTPRYLVRRYPGTNLSDISYWAETNRHLSASKSYLHLCSFAEMHASKFEAIFYCFVLL